MNDVRQTSEPPALSKDLLGRLTERLGIPSNLATHLDGLRTVYRAWCSNIPFDNMRKMISLRAGSQLAGLDAEDFFENYLANGTGGTCWPSSNALYVLVRDLGFHARRAAGSMFEMPDVNHGTVKVRLDGEDWMVDSSMLTYEPFRVTSETYITGGTHPVETEVYDGSYVIWVDFPPLPEFIPCRMRLDPVDSGFYTERYEVFSRTQSPFNEKLYFRKGGPDGTTVLFGHTRFKRNGEGLDVEEFDRDGLCSYLVQTAGVSQKLVDDWAASGSLDATFAESERPPSPPLDRARPSRR
ncbi:MAG TPA: arylamine N-acetyltransferase [Pyrinomonadaceae bacterium]|nr:arylamine N-acetyltransferase [Pyrinomonadaceae bacterium]